MARTDASTVKETFDTSESDPTINAWIGIANDIVDDIASADSTISSSRLTNIETLVAQHLLAIQDRRVESDSIGDSEIAYQGETGMHFDASLYGQQAKMLDPTNVLQNKKKATAGVDVLDSRNIDRPNRD